MTLDSSFTFPNSPTTFFPINSVVETTKGSWSFEREISNGKNPVWEATESSRNASSNSSERSFAIRITSLSKATASQQVNQINQTALIYLFCERKGIEGVLRLKGLSSAYSPDGRSEIYEVFPRHEEIHTNMSFEEKRSFLNSLAKTIYNLHENDIVHWDIKPSNILVTNQKTPCLSDFECSWMSKGKATDHAPQKIPTTVEELEEFGCNPPDKSEGDLRYRAPRPRGENESPKARDCFAFGATAYEILSGISLYEDAKKEILELEGKEIKNPFGYLVNLNQKILFQLVNDRFSEYPLAADLLTNLLSLDESQWMTMEEVIKHPFFQYTGCQSF